ncbi:MAG: thioredoxin family protein [Burkholderiaceae bacterium]|nr:thioredoxin family protein [Burkholderiaceae bacterium]
MTPLPEADLYRPLLAATLARAAAAADDLAVICLCAAWCRTCDGYQQVFDAVAASHPGLAFRWLDIEDEAREIDDIDVQTFPTLIIGNARQVRFAGPVLPQAAHLEKLLRGL